MSIFILSQFKIESLEQNASGDMVLDDLIQLIELRTTRILDDEDLAKEIFSTEKSLKYFYQITIQQRRT